MDEFHAYQLDSSKNALLKNTLLEFQNKLKKIQGMQSVTSGRLLLTQYLGLFHIVNRFDDPLLVQIESPHQDTPHDLLNSMSNI